MPSTAPKNRTSLLARSIRRLVPLVVVCTTATVAITAVPAFADGSGDNPCAQPTIVGTPGDDRLTGTDGADVIAPGKGDDHVDGVEGDDVICGGDGRDTLIGGPGDDRLHGDSGKDKLRGGSGEDRLDGGKSDDTCMSGEKHRSCDDKRKDPGFTTTVTGARGAKASVNALDRIPTTRLEVHTGYDTTRVALDNRVSYSYRFESQMEFTSAEITLPYFPDSRVIADYADKHGGDKPKFGVYGFDDTHGLWVRQDGRPRVDTKKHTVTMRVEHFSQYSVFAETPGQQQFEGYWESKPRWCANPGDPVPGFDTAFVIGTDAGTGAADPAGLRAEAAKRFATAMQPTDSAAVIGYAQTPTTYWSLLPLDLTSVDTALDQTKIAGGSPQDLGAGVTAAVDELSANGTEGRPRIAILVGDGQGLMADTAVKYAVEKDVVFYTAGVGTGGMGKLRNLAAQTGGEFVQLTDAAQLAPFYAELRADLTDPGTDTDGDTVTDCVERRGALVAPGFYESTPLFQSGRYVRTDPNDTDTDDDSLADGDELGPRHDLGGDPELADSYRFLIEAGITLFFNPTSNPASPDTDNERLTDPLERYYGTSSFKPDTDGDGSTDFEEVEYGVTSPIEPNGWIWAGSGGDGAPEQIPGLAPLTLIKPDTNDYPWNYDVMSWSVESGDCSAECAEIHAWAQDEYEEQGWLCQLLTSCQPDDLRIEWIEQAVDAQKVFTYPGGHMRKEFVVDFFAYNCQRLAARQEECFSETMEDAADQDLNYQDLVEALAEVMASIPGGTRPPDPEIDEAHRKLQRLAEQACRETPRPDGMKPDVWGTNVHKRFEELITEFADPTLFGETGYRNGQVVQKVTGPDGRPQWPAGTRAPDAVFGAPDNPRAMFDLKTGEKMIEAKWIRELLDNLVGLIPFGRTVELIELTC